jgi:hypothetical protein
MIATQIVDREEDMEAVLRPNVLGRENSGRVQDRVERPVRREDALCCLSNSSMSRKITLEKRGAFPCLAEGRQRRVSLP